MHETKFVFCQANGRLSNRETAVYLSKQIKRNAWHKWQNTSWRVIFKRNRCLKVNNRLLGRWWVPLERWNSMITNLLITANTRCNILRNKHFKKRSWKTIETWNKMQKPNSFRFSFEAANAETKRRRGICVEIRLSLLSTLIHHLQLFMLSPQQNWKQIIVATHQRSLPEF